MVVLRGFVTGAFIFPGMLLTIQFPIADSRQFLAEPTGFLNSPPWRFSVDPGRDFVRSFGKIEKRRLGGLTNWIGERSICFARRAVRFPDQKALNFHNSENQHTIPLKVVFRRFFSDGFATGKFEIGIGTRRDEAADLHAFQTRKLIEYCLDLKIKIPYEDDLVSLANAGKRVANLYLKASSNRKQFNSLQPEKWWVEACKPILFFVYSESEGIEMPFHPKLVKKVEKATNSYRVEFCKVPWKNGLEIGMWIIRFSGGIDYKSIRELRIALLRLYAERQCVRAILRNIGKQRIIIPKKATVDDIKIELDAAESENNYRSDLFQRYWQTAVGRIGDYKRMANVMTDALPEEDDISETARQAEDLIEPGEREEILIGLENIRPNYIKTIKQFIHNDYRNYGKIEEQVMTKNVESEQTIEQQNNFGDNTTVGALGKGDAIMHGDIVQKSTGANIDMQALLADLTKLRIELDKRKSDSAEDSLEIGKIAQAEVEAQKGNTSKVWDILKTSGKWVLDTATEIGTKVAVEAIKDSMGIK